MGIRDLARRWLIQSRGIRHYVGRVAFAARVAQRNFPGRFRPVSVQVENTNLCNSRCVMCPRTAMTRPTGTMEFELFQSIVEQCRAWGVRKVFVQNYGEPLLDPGLLKKVALVKEAGLECRVITNGSLLSDDMAGGLIDIGLDLLQVSFDGGSRETYESVRRGLKFENVLGNVRHLVRLREEAGKRKPAVTIRMIDLNGDASERERFVSLWQDLPVDLVIFKPATWGTGDEPAVLQDIRPPKPRRFCINPWVALVVLWDGRAPLCCIDYDGRYIVGDATRQSLKEIWLGQPFRTIRRAFRMDALPDMCQKCSYGLTDESLFKRSALR